MQNLKIPPLLWWLILFLLTLPLWFIFMNPFHDWGDDFAQYLLQARKFSGNSSAISFDATGYAPSLKGWLFSVLLIPAVAAFPLHEIMASKVIVTAFATASVFPLYLIAIRRLHCSPLTAISVCGCYLFNYQSLLIKDQILPEFAFIFTSALALWLASSSNAKQVISGLTLALLNVGIKSSGWVLFLLLLVWSYRNGIISNRVRRFMILIIAIVIAGTFLVLPSSSGVFWYLQQTISGFSFHTCVEHLSIYYHTIPKFFEMEIPMWMNHLIFLIFLTGWLGEFIYGNRSFMNNKAGFSGYLIAFQLLYLLMLTVYPYAGEPFRFLFPLLPFSLLSSLAFYNRLLVRTSFHPAVGIVTLLLMLTTLPGIKKTMTMQQDYGPFRSENRALFQFLKSQADFPGAWCTTKPFAFTYFTGLPFIPISVHASPGSRWVIPSGNQHRLVLPPQRVQVYSNSQWIVFDEEKPVSR